MVVETFQLLHHVVQLQDGLKGLDVTIHTCHRWGVKLEDGVVLTQSLPDKLCKQKYTTCFNH